MVTAQAQHRAVMLLVEVKSLQCVFDFFRKSDDLQAVRSLVLTPTVSEVLCYLSSSFALVYFGVIPVVEARIGVTDTSNENCTVSYFLRRQSDPARL
jgi:hypothetical protein